jgi:hypothetical protein
MQASFEMHGVAKGVIICGTCPKHLYIEVTAEPEQETPIHAAPQGSPPPADQPVS